LNAGMDWSTTQCSFGNPQSLSTVHIGLQVSPIGMNGPDEPVVPVVPNVPVVEDVVVAPVPVPEVLLVTPLVGPAVEPLLVCSAPLVVLPPLALVELPGPLMLWPDEVLPVAAPPELAPLVPALVTDAVVEGADVPQPRTEITTHTAHQRFMANTSRTRARHIERRACDVKSPDILRLMRIVAVADTHLFHADLTIPAGDVFVHAGDLCRGGSLEELEIAARWLHSLPHRTKVVVAGNHDWAFVREPQLAREVLGPNVLYLQDSEATIDGLRFWGTPWQPAYNDWAFNLPRGVPLAEKWSLIPEGIDVLVTHAPPEGIGDAGPVGGRQGCAELLARVRRVQPRLHLFGHIHQDGGFWRQEKTCFANVTTWECERGPTVVTIDSADRTVREELVPPSRD
jgi:predicted phosphohydrolase